LLLKSIWCKEQDNRNHQVGKSLVNVLVNITFKTRSKSEKLTLLLRFFIAHPSLYIILPRSTCTLTTYLRKSGAPTIIVCSSVWTGLRVNRASLSLLAGLDVANGQTHCKATDYILPQVGMESKYLSDVGKGWDISTSLDQNNGREPAGPSHLLDL